MWVTPELVSYVSKDVDSAHGTPDVSVSVMTPRTSARALVDVVLAKGRLTEEVTPLATVNEVAAPITVPAALAKEMAPVHDAAVPLDDDVARFVTLTWAVSELANPTGGKLDVRVVVVLDVAVWAMATAAVNPVEAMSVVTNRRKSIA
jgi:hypothetical protein